jgi:KaiC/GvpD/RAD55 family RecA-like ATPase
VSIITSKEAVAIWRNRLALGRIPTGIQALDSAIGTGLPIGQVTVIVGYTGTHKSELVRHIANHCITSDDTGVIHVDVELGVSRIIDRNICELARVAPEYLEKIEKLPAQVRAKVEAVAKSIGNRDNIVFLRPDSAWSPQKLSQAILEAAASLPSKIKRRLIVLDSLQRLSEGAKGIDTRIQVRNFAYWSAYFAEKYEMAILLTSEERRASSGDKRITTTKAKSKGAESRAIEYTADIQIVISPVEMPASEFVTESGETAVKAVRLLIAKNRHGGEGWLRNDLEFIQPCWDMKEVRRPSVQAAIHKAMAGGEDITIRQIQKMTRLQASKIKPVLEDLMSSGKITQTRNGGRLGAAWAKTRGKNKPV